MGESQPGNHISVVKERAFANQKNGMAATNRGEITWCEDKINPDDIEYVLASELATLRTGGNRMNKCKHETSTTMVGDDGISHEFTSDELIQIRAHNAELRQRVAAADDLRDSVIDAVNDLYRWHILEGHESTYDYCQHSVCSYSRALMAVEKATADDIALEATE